MSSLTSHYTPKLLEKSFPRDRNTEKEMEFVFQPFPWPLIFNSPVLSSSITRENYVHWTHTPESHVYTADLPGVKKEQIKVEVEDSKYMIIRAYATADGDETTISMPPAKSFMRKFRLPGLINIDGISAGYEDGVLTVTVPRSFVRGVLRINLADLPDRHEILAAAA